jgi:GNAT superfamily N-acetyltransferase
MRGRRRSLPNRPGPTVLRSVRSANDLETVRVLFREYRQWLADHREVTAFDDSILKVGLRDLDQEIDALPGAYGPPRGALFLALEGPKPIGCGALRPLGRNVGEIKRVYVRPTSRGGGLGRRITRAALNRARKLGYQRVVLDTLPTMTPAIALYTKMGFVPIEAYWAHPVPGALFFEYRFRRTPARRASPQA